MVPSLIVAFLTGLTAGGIGCLVAQCGLLATSLAPTLETDRAGRTGEGSAGPGGPVRPRPLTVIGLFLFAKLAAYTALGALLGAFGSLLRLTPAVRAGLMIAVGAFVLANGLRMLAPRSFLRWLVLEPPSAVTRLVRRASRRGPSAAGPLLLGALTVLLPCGISQAMMAAAVGTGDAVHGAALLFAFTAGTLPLFYVAAYATVRLGSALEASLSGLVALVFILVGLTSILFGLNLAGVQVPIPRPLAFITAAPVGSIPSPPAEAATEFTIAVSEDGYAPQVLHLPSGRPVTLLWVTRGGACCSRAVVIPGLKAELLLPDTGRTPLAVPPQPPGTILTYSCSTGRRTGRLVFDP